MVKTMVAEEDDLKQIDPETTLQQCITYSISLFIC